MDRNELVKVIHGHCARMRTNGDHLFTLSEAFYMTGNQEMASRLEVIANNLYESADGIESDMHSNIVAEFNESQANVGHTLEALLRQVNGGTS